MASLRLIFLAELIFLSFASVAQIDDPVKVGLTLSGGGAKGLAHIGILQAIDSAGLKVEGITGTSMGAVVGSLYAIGYSGKEIEHLARQLDWNDLFLTVPKLKEVGFLQKDEYGKYPIQIPLEKGKIKAYTGILEAQGIWKEFGKLYFPVYDVKDFSKFNIPFECIATDLVTGQAVVLREGDIISAIRASMAIPSVFTAVDYKGTKLVDGGVVRNFPVDNLKDFGVNYFIGVNLSIGLHNVDKLKSPIDVLLQIAFFSDAKSFSDQRELCNILIEPDIGDFSAGSFNSADSIIDLGIAEGLKYYPYFKKLADSLNHTQSKVQITERLPTAKKIVLDDIQVSGLSKSVTKNFKGQLGLELGKSCEAAEISDALDNAFRTLAYKKIRYELIPTDTGHAIINYNVQENPKSFFNVGLHYTAYSGSALVASLTSQNRLSKYSRSSIKLNVSENFRARLKHQHFFNQNQRWGVEVSAYFEHFKFPIYVDFEQRFLYTRNYEYADVNIFKLFSKANILGFGLKKEWVSLKPSISPIEFITAKNNFWNSYFFAQRNTTDDQAFPHKGTKVDLQTGMVTGQNPDAVFVELTGKVDLGDSIKITNANYPYLLFKMSKFFPIKNHTTIITRLSTGINFKPERSFLNYYSVGGLQDFLRNQIPFAGLKENQVNTNSVASFQLGVQVQPIKNFFVSLKSNTALYDFTELQPREWTKSNFISGYSLSAGYSSILGPIELSLLYNDQSKKFAGYIVVGFAF